MIKRLFFLTALVLMSLPALSQNLVSSFLTNINYKAKEGIIRINISGKVLLLAAGNNADKDKLFESIDVISVVSGLYADDKLKQQLEKNLIPYSELMSVMEGENQIRMYIKETKKLIEEFVLCVHSDNKITLMSITGKIDLKHIARLSESFKIEGVENLKHLEKLNK